MKLLTVGRTVTGTSDKLLSRSLPETPFLLRRCLYLINFLRMRIFINIPPNASSALYLQSSRWRKCSFTLFCLPLWNGRRKQKTVPWVRKILMSLCKLYYLRIWNHIFDWFNFESNLNDILQFRIVFCFSWFL